VGAHSVGLCLARYVLAIEPLASMDTAALIDVAGDVTQRILTAKLPAAATGATTRRTGAARP
jgi:hypothetical protein